MSELSLPISNVEYSFDIGTSHDQSVDETRLACRINSSIKDPFALTMDIYDKTNVMNTVRWVISRELVQEMTEADESSAGDGDVNGYTYFDSDRNKKMVDVQLLSPNGELIFCIDHTTLSLFLAESHEMISVEEAELRARKELDRTLKQL